MVNETDDIQERRLPGTDRRTRSRQGKFDRRRNRCGHCQFFTLPNTPDEANGFCQQHQKPMAIDEFACTLFQGLAKL